MKNSIVFFGLLIIFLLFSCSPYPKMISKADSEKIEFILAKHKKYAFMDLYRKSLLKEENNYNIQKCDSIFDLSASELISENCLKIDFYSDDHPFYADTNYESLIESWLNKQYPPFAPTDDANLKTSMTFKKVFDFYESADLNKYIDSLRTVFHEKHLNNNLKSIDCIK